MDWPWRCPSDEISTDDDNPPAFRAVVGKKAGKEASGAGRPL
jgi:hypothetical protein